MPRQKYLWTQVDTQGRVVIPAEVRRLLSLEPGKQVAFVIDGSEVGLMTVDQGIRLSQALARKLIKRNSGQSIVDELIAERRAEATRE